MRLGRISDSCLLPFGKSISCLLDRFYQKLWLFLSDRLTLTFSLCKYSEVKEYLGAKYFVLILSSSIASTKDLDMYDRLLLLSNNILHLTRI